MSFRFATTEQETFVDSLDTEISAYQQKFVDIIEYFAGFIELVSENSGIETRYISAEGNEDIDWRGALLSASPTETKVDVWCFSFDMTQLLSDKENGAGYFNKPFSLGVDFFYDYDFGTDSNNSEKIFNERVNAFEFVIETLRTSSDAALCLPHCCSIEGGLFKRMIKRFPNSSTHIARGDLSLRMKGL